ncbi:DUF2726 domain-containing protein [Deinococcus planocerae]|uniref:DUF2726 domain-containing protein n=1 Tax=Deinococcus planocerae TaxID=1737569 RepID=UPI000C7ED5A9|nr:DUF2726 domain-containing protein [Deinococcus planocerae]
MASLKGTGYLVFPNVRLNDLFLISRAAQNRQSVLGRLRDKHVDFLILEERDFKPVLAIELDGASHDTERQRYRDEVKNTAFRSAGLRLLRFDARQTHSARSLQADLAHHLPLLQVG